MKGTKLAVIFAVILLLVFVWAFAQTSQKEAEKEEPTAFQTRCSICHSLEDVRSGMEKTLVGMHEKAGVQISQRSLEEIEKTFTLLPVDEPHKGMFQEKCGKCHGLDVVVKAHQTKDDAEMTKIIEKMAKKEKSGIAAEEIEKLHESMMILNEIYEPDVELMKQEKK